MADFWLFYWQQLLKVTQKKSHKSIASTICHFPILWLLPSLTQQSPILSTTHGIFICFNIFPLPHLDLDVLFPLVNFLSLFSHKISASEREGKAAKIWAQKICYKLTLTFNFALHFYISRYSNWLCRWMITLNYFQTNIL